jgi:ankyrin repeat protein
MLGHEEVVKFLVETRADRDAKDREGRSPPHLTAMAGKEAVVTFLLGKGAKIEGKSRNVMTALFHAAEAGHKATVETLIKHGADKEVQTSRGNDRSDLQLRMGTRRSHDCCLTWGPVTIGRIARGRI